MSEEQRLHLRRSYMQGWYDLDADLLVSSTAFNFVFEDPAEPEPITREMLPAYMLRWDKRTRLLDSNNEWRLTNEVLQDKDGMLTHWEWWELLDTPLQGAAIVLTGNNGVELEKITYFTRNA